MATVYCHTGASGMLSVTAKAIQYGADTFANIVAPSQQYQNATELTVDKGTYFFTSTNLSGLYKIKLFSNGSSIAFWYGWALLRLGSGTIICEDTPRTARDLLILEALATGKTSVVINSDGTTVATFYQDDGTTVAFTVGPYNQTTGVRTSTGSLP